jgi:hypothetical protein
MRENNFKGKIIRNVSFSISLSNWEEVNKSLFKWLTKNIYFEKTVIEKLEDEWESNNNRHSDLYA